MECRTITHHFDGQVAYLMAQTLSTKQWILREKQCTPQQTMAKHHKENAREKKSNNSADKRKQNVKQK